MVALAVHCLDLDVHRFDLNCYLVQSLVMHELDLQVLGVALQWRRRAIEVQVRSERWALEERREVLVVVQHEVPDVQLLDVA